MMEPTLHHIASLPATVLIAATSLAAALPEAGRETLPAMGTTNLLPADTLDSGGGRFGHHVAAESGIIAVSGNLSPSISVYDRLSLELLGTIDRTTPQTTAWEPLAIANGRIVTAAIGPEANQLEIYDATTRQLLRTIDSPNLLPIAQFGKWELDAAGDVIVARSQTDNFNSPAFVHVFDAATGTHLGDLVPVGGSPGDTFRSPQVATDGEHIAVALPFAAGGGAVHLYDAGTLGHVRELARPAISAAPDKFGIDVAMHDGLIAVSATASTQGFLDSAAFLYRTDGPDHQAEFIVPGLDIGFGGQIDLDGETLAIGHPFDDSARFDGGAVFLFDHLADEFMGSMTGSDLLPNANLGWEVAVSGGTVIAGAPGMGTAFALQAGSPPCNPADFADERGVLDLADIQAFITAFVAMSPAADLNNSATFDLVDVQIFAQAFVAGCS